MKSRLWIIIGAIIVAAVYLPIHYYYPFLGMGITTKTFVFCENGFVQSDNKCVPDPKIFKDIAVDTLADEFCPNNTLEQNETGTFLTCLRTNDNPKEIIFDLPQPVYMLKLCTSMHGCSNPYMWTPQIPSNLISEEEKQQAVDKVLSLPQTKKWPAEPKMHQFLITQSQDRWEGTIEFFVAGVMMPQHDKCEYYDSATIDLETFEIHNGFRDFDDFKKCENQ